MARRCVRTGGRCQRPVALSEISESERALSEKSDDALFLLVFGAETVYNQRISKYDRVIYMSKWKALIEQLSEDNNNVVPNPPATQTQLAEIEEKLKVVLPLDMRDCLLELDGDNWLIFSVAQIIEINTMVRAMECFMPLDCLLFIAGNGCGDYFGYPIRGDGIDGCNLFIWEHENDNRVWRASGLSDLIEKYYRGEI